MKCSISFLSLFAWIALLAGHCALTAPLPSDVCHQASPVARKFFTIDRFLFFSENANNFETYRILNLSSGAITSRHNWTDFSAQVKESPMWAFTLDVADEGCASEAPTSPYCARVRYFENLVVVRGESRQLAFMRLEGSGSGISLVPVQDPSSNFIEMQVLLKHLDKFGYVSSLTIDKKRGQYASTHFGLLSQICLTTIRHQGKRVLLPYSLDVLNDDVFSTQCFPSSQSYNSVITLREQLFGCTSSGTVDKLSLNGGRFQSGETLLDKAFLKCPLVRNRMADGESTEEASSYGLFSLIFTGITVAAILITGFACYLGKINAICCCKAMSGSVKGAINAVKSSTDGGNSSKSSSSKKRKRKHRSRSGSKSRSRSKSSRKHSKSKRESRSSRSGSKKSKKSSKPSDSKGPSDAALSASNMAKTLKSLRVLGQQLNSRLVAWKTPKGSLRPLLSNDPSSMWTKSSVSVTPITDDTENGGIDLTTLSSGTELHTGVTPSTATSVCHSPTELNTKSPESIHSNEGDLESDGEDEEEVGLPKETTKEGMPANSTDFLTTTNSSLLSTENKLESKLMVTSSRGSLFKRRYSFFEDALQTKPLFEKGSLSHAINDMLEQYHQDKPNEPTSLEGRSPFIQTPSSSPSLPHLLKPSLLAKMARPVRPRDNQP